MEFHSDEFRRARRISLGHEPVVSTLPAQGLTWSLLFFVPLVPLIGAIIGFRGGIIVRRDGLPNGGFRSAMAVLLGLIFTVGQVGLGYRGYQYVGTLKNAPQEAIAASVAGDLETFESQFADGDIEPVPMAAQAFVDEVQRRYGKLVRCRRISGLGVPNAVYEIELDDRTLEAEASFTVMGAPGVEWLESRLSYLEIRDPELGDLRFPGTEPSRVASHP
ncbi:MAG: hypothetical protein ACYTGC_19470 [Planctomycetota bacterium]|jgi:hypothetical protein